MFNKNFWLITLCALLIISIYTGLNIFSRIALGANGLIILADVIISVRRLAKEKKRAIKNSQHIASFDLHLTCIFSFK